jgi:hypothetical protein
LEGVAKIELADADADAIAETMIRSAKVVVMGVMKCIVSTAYKSLNRGGYWS